MTEYNCRFIFEEGFDDESFFEELENFIKVNSYKGLWFYDKIFEKFPEENIIIDGIIFPKAYCNKVYFDFYSRDFEVFRSEIYKKFIETIMSKYKENLLEITSGCNIQSGLYGYYYCESLDLFLKTTICERWGYNILEIKHAIQDIKEFMKNAKYLKSDGSIYYYPTLCKDSIELKEYVKSKYNIFERIEELDYYYS